MFPFQNIYIYIYSSHLGPLFFRISHLVFKKKKTKDFFSLPLFFHAFSSKIFSVSALTFFFSKIVTIFKHDASYGLLNAMSHFLNQNFLNRKFSRHDELTWQMGHEFWICNFYYDFPKFQVHILSKTIF